MLLAGPILTLTDGREIKGVDLRRDGEIFIVALADGSSLPVPRAAVTKLEWTGQGGGAGRPARPVSIVTGRTDAEQQEYDARAAVSARESEAWAERYKAEEAERDRKEEREKMESWIRDNWAFIQPSGLTGPGVWQQSIVNSTLQPSYWVPDPNQNIGNWP